jgi:hypothetical protein
MKVFVRQISLIMFLEELRYFGPDFVFRSVCEGSARHMNDKDAPCQSGPRTDTVLSQGG